MTRPCDALSKTRMSWNRLRCGRVRAFSGNAGPRRGRASLNPGSAAARSVRLSVSRACVSELHPSRREARLSAGNAHRVALAADEDVERRVVPFRPGVDGDMALREHQHAGDAAPSAKWWKCPCRIVAPVASAARRSTGRYGPDRPGDRAPEVDDQMRAGVAHAAARNEIVLRVRHAAGVAAVPIMVSGAPGRIRAFIACPLLTVDDPGGLSLSSRLSVRSGFAAIRPPDGAFATRVLRARCPHPDSMRDAAVVALDRG